MMELNISGLKCDNCDYRDDSIKFADYKNYINKPCPEYGSNLLTQKEYNECIKYYNWVEMANKIGNILKWFNPLYYWRLIFGDKRKQATLTIDYPKRKE